MKLPVTLNTTQPISASQRQAVFYKKKKHAVHSSVKKKQVKKLQQAYSDTHQYCNTFKTTVTTFSSYSFGDI